jgi:FKBP-type peptidyl-prolyl cis-trans isomerase FkpA
MRLRMRAGFVVAVMAMASTVGCTPPAEIVPVAPPGLEFQRAPVAPGEGAQALGEQPAAAARQANAATAKVANSPPTPIGQPAKSPSGLVYETLKEGTGPSAQSGQTVTIHYTGTLTDGQVFDSSREGNKPPFTVVIGTGRVIPGWDEGVPGMKVGERRKLTIPPELAYGAQGQGKIPPNSTLIFDVDLLDIK